MIFNPHRRRFLSSLAASSMMFAMPALAARPSQKQPLLKKIPSSGESIPAVGMGTWLTFDVDEEQHGARSARVKVLEKFFQMGGGLIDSSPMYGFSEEVLGYCLNKLSYPETLFAATKVWVEGKQQGIYEMERSAKLWGVPRFDLMQIHNMLDWEIHWETLQDWKKSGRIRYIGITTSHGSRHKAMEKALQLHDFDFVQLTYNIRDREAESRLLPLAQEKGIAVIANRPFRRADLFSQVEGKTLPMWAREFDCENWAQFFLKYIISHPAISCAIPATSQVKHMQENMGAAYGKLPEAEMRKKMQRYFRDI